jgi:hypothetical protein
VKKYITYSRPLSRQTINISPDGESNHEMFLINSYKKSDYSAELQGSIPRIQSNSPTIKVQDYEGINEDLDYEGVHKPISP